MDSEIQIEETEFSVNSRIIESALTPNKDTFRALCELINNSLQASATEIKITIDTDTKKDEELFGISSIVIEDNGVGISKSDFSKKILEMATNTKRNGKGIGRFSAFQLGYSVLFETVAFDKKEKQSYKTTVLFNFDEMRNKTLKDLPINVLSQTVSNRNSYFRIVITDMCYSKDDYKDKKPYQISPKLNTDYDVKNNIWYHIFINYTMLVVNDNVRFIINNKELEKSRYEISTEEFKKEFLDPDGNKHTFEYKAMQYNSDKKHSNKTICLMVDNNNIQNIAAEYEYKVNTPDVSSWRIYIYSEYINKMADTFRTISQLDDMDEDLLRLKEIIQEHVNSFFLEKYKDFFDFDKKLKEHESYLYKNKKAPSETYEFVYSRFCYCIEEEYHILEKKNALTKVIYPLVNKCIENGDFAILLDKIGSLPKEAVRNFKSLLEKADLEYVVSFSSEVANKRIFLDVLSIIAYDEPYKKNMTETDQLHKMIEKNLWIFGTEYNGTKVVQSNKSIGNTFKKLREEHLKPINNVEKNDDRMDLFVWTEIQKNDEHNEVLVIELKRFAVKIDVDEINQIGKYRFAIENEDALSKLGLSYKLILVSSDISKYARSTMMNKKSGLLHKTEDNSISTYIYTWADIIENNNKKLSYLGKYLETKDQDVVKYIEENHSDIDITKLESKINKK